jgi:hypothetical protein
MTTAPPIIYTFAVPKHPGHSTRPYTTVRDALYTAVLDLEQRRATPLRIARAGQVLYCPAAILRLWEACRAELGADPWQVPRAIQALGEADPS